MRSSVLSLDRRDLRIDIYLTVNHIFYRTSCLIESSIICGSAGLQGLRCRSTEAQRPVIYGAKIVSYGRTTASPFVVPRSHLLLLSLCSDNTRPSRDGLHL